MREVVTNKLHTTLYRSLQDSMLSAQSLSCLPLFRCRLSRTHRQRVSRPYVVIIIIIATSGRQHINLSSAVYPRSAVSSAAHGSHRRPTVRPRFADRIRRSHGAHKRPPSAVPPRAGRLRHTPAVQRARRAVRRQGQVLGDGARRRPR